MGSSRLILVTLAMIVCASIDCVTSSIDTNFSMMKVVDNFMCNFHKSSDDPSSCLLGGKLNDCGAYKCYKTIGQQCAPKRTDAQLTGARCGHNLNCGCDKKCEGCMEVNGKEICHDSPLECNNFRKRNFNPIITALNRNLDFPIDEMSAV